MGANRRGARRNCAVGWFVLWVTLLPGQAYAQKQMEAPRESFPVKIYRDFLIVAEGRAGDSHVSQAFILDTGTSPSVINARVATELGLTTSASTITALGKTADGKEATLSHLQLGPVRVDRLRVQVQDLSRVERDFGLALGGIIGLDVLAKSSFRIDYRRQRIEFGEVSDEGVPVPIDRHRSLAVARVTFGKKPMRMLVDTGTDQVVLVGEKFAESGGMGLRRTSQEGSSLREHAMQMEMMMEPELALDGQRFTVSRAYYVRGEADPEFDGLLGVRALGFQAVAYDRAHATMYLQR